MAFSLIWLAWVAAFACGWFCYYSVIITLKRDQKLYFFQIIPLENEAKVQYRLSKHVVQSLQRLYLLSVSPQWCGEMQFSRWLLWWTKERRQRGEEGVEEGGRLVRWWEQINRGISTLLNGIALFGPLGTHTNRHTHQSTNVYLSFW